MGNNPSLMEHGRSSHSFVLQRKACADEKFKRSTLLNDGEIENADSKGLAARPIEWDNESSVAAHSRINLLENVRPCLARPRFWRVADISCIKLLPLRRAAATCVSQPCPSRAVLSTDQLPPLGRHAMMRRLSCMYT